MKPSSEAVWRTRSPALLPDKKGQGEYCYLMFRGRHARTVTPPVWSTSREAYLYDQKRRFWPGMYIPLNFLIITDGY